jgi:16S rRNA (uracil1498-N3)-methyltransferase
MAIRVYLPDARQKGPIVVVDGSEAHYLGRVRRVSVGEMVEVFDGRGFGSLAEVVKVEKRRVELSLVGDPLPDRLPRLRLTVVSAFPKGDRVDWMVEKLSELGVSRLVPLVSAHSVVDPHPAKLERLRRTVVEAAKQCGRNTLMEIAETEKFDRLVKVPNEPASLLVHPGGQPFRAWRKPAFGDSWVVAIGPEGGFSEAEVEAAKAVEWQLVGLGPTILRVETAALTASALLLALAEGSNPEQPGERGG